MVENRITREKVLREETARYTCDCNKVGGPYEWIKQGDGNYTCPFCGEELVKDEIIHKRVTYTVDEDGFIVV